MDDRIGGQQLVQLPNAYQVLVRVRFGKAEKIIYRAVVKKFVEMINAEFAKGDGRKPMTYWFVQVTRLRQ